LFDFSPSAKWPTARVLLINLKTVYPCSVTTNAFLQHAPGTKLEGWFKDVGFVNIQHRLIKLPWGHWPRDPDMKEIGVYNLQQLLNGADAFTLRPFCEILGWSEEEVKVFMIGVRKELKDPRIHGYYEL